MVRVVGVVQESATVGLVDCGVIWVALRDVVRSVVAYRVLGIEALVLSVISLHGRLDAGLVAGVAVAVLSMAQSAVVCAMELLRDFLKNFLPFP